MAVNPEDFIRQTDCVYKDEHYSVRDNGAVLRHSGKNKRLRALDNQWTFGTPNDKGYLVIASAIIHRIVAYAFLGEPPSAQHIVDHKDTNRKNNRPENLRWLTKLENILNNPITLKKIAFHCGSIEAFLKDPSILKGYERHDPNFAWMKTVTPEEAESSWTRLNRWATRENNSGPSIGARLGESIFQPLPNSYSIQEVPELTDSKTPNAVQRNWNTPSEFPNCPQTITGNPVEGYAANLKVGETFSRNQYCNAIVEDLATSKDGTTLWVICKNSNERPLKPWLLTQVTFEDNLFVHANLGSFFKRDGAEKYFTLAQGLEWTGGDTYDDLT